ncbi:MAG: 16S rRNA (cytosine(967)-C(5))-methyltransferase RsmB [Desulfopila sp.]
MHKASPPARTSRFAAIETLVRLERTRHPLKVLLETVAEQCRLPAMERRLAMKLAYGVLRQRQYLEFLLTRLCNRPIDQLDPVVRSALLVGLYQLFCLSRIPVSAAVNETVNAVKAMGLRQHLRGFVNGVLRGASRRRNTLPTPAGLLTAGHPVLNHPEWLTDRWLSHFGLSEMRRICASNNREPQLTLRVNSRRISRNSLAERLAQAGISAHPGSYAPDSLVLPDYQGMIPTLPGYTEGAFQIQDEAAQLATLLLGPFTQPLSCLDACAGVGGKTCHLLQLVDSASQVVALEPEPQRFVLLQKNIERLGSDSRLVVRNCRLQDLRHQDQRQFDRVLLDAPCSGTGVIGRQPDIRWNRQPADLGDYQRDQLALLDAAAALVAPDGLLVYTTCSIEPEENQEVVAAFLTAHPAFVLDPCRTHLPPAAAPLIDGSFFAPRPAPSIAGFFGARLWRRRC